MIIDRRPARPPALSRANEFIKEVHADVTSDERELIQSTILCAAQYIYEKAGPGAWEALDPEGFLPRMPARNDHEQAGICLYLIGFIGWMAFQGYIEPIVARAIVQAAGRANPGHPAVAALCGQTVELLGEQPGPLN